MRKVDLGVPTSGDARVLDHVLTVVHVKVHSREAWGLSRATVSPHTAWTVTARDGGPRTL
jgi:hypothetical protein